MKNPSLFRRFILGSLIMGATIPMVYHIGRDIFRSNHFKQITEQACKAIEPMIQKGSQREPLEYLSSTIRNQGLYADPEIEMKDHGRFISPAVKHPFMKNSESCDFKGISGVEVKVYYSRVPLLDITYLYLYLLSIPILFLMFMYARRSIIRLQKKVADIIEYQMKHLFGIESGQTKQPTNGMLYKLLDLEIPLLKYLKKHIDSLESDLKIYSQKIAEQQKRDVLKDVASQMAHEIISPISTLQSILQDKNILDKRELLLDQLSQIKFFSENLLREYRGEPVLPKEMKQTIDVIASIETTIESVKFFAQNLWPIDFVFKNQFEGEKLFVNGDRNQFVAAISNLLRNSIEALDKPKKVIEITLENHFPKFNILIKDNGCGIKSENIEKIFDKRVSIGKANGTGLGLYQVRNTINSMHGIIEVTSIFGEGTVFNIELPVSFKKVDSAINPIKLKDPTQKPDLVLIDDTYANHIAWEIEAGRSNKNLISFFSVSEFLNDSDKIDKNTPIFVDYVFGEDLAAGKEISQQLLSKGFTKVFIASGLNENSISAPTGVKVVGKSFPLAELA